MKVIVMAHNHQEAKEEFCKKYTPGNMAHWTTIRAHVHNPRMMRDIKKEIPDTYMMFEISARFKYNFEV